MIWKKRLRHFGRFLFTLSFLFALTVAASAENTLFIAIDIGHTKAYPGAMSARGVGEFTFNQAFTQQLLEAFAAQGQRVRLINENGDLRKLETRTQAARGAAFLISIHHDSVQPHYLEKWTYNGVERLYSDRFSGFSLFVSRLNPHFAVSLRCASTIGRALRAEGFHFTTHHAEPVPGENREWADAENGVYYYDELVVLKTASQPAVLFEAGIVVNRAEELNVQSVGRQQNMAKAVAIGLFRCKILK